MKLLKPWRNYADITTLSSYHVDDMKYSDLMRSDNSGAVAIIVLKGITKSISITMFVSNEELSAIKAMSLGYGLSSFGVKKIISCSDMSYEEFVNIDLNKYKEEVISILETHCGYTYPNEKQALLI